jgi:hypothetical protein
MKMIRSVLVSVIPILVAAYASAADTASATSITVNGSAEADEAVSLMDEAAQATAEAENTAEVCNDLLDNDLDSHTDCRDQDCEAVEACAAETKPKKEPENTVETQTHIETPTASITLYHSGVVPETRQRCSDNIDNNGNGLTDCEEASCQRSRYCRKTMYEYRIDEKRPPGLFVNFGLGVALPNYRSPRATTDSMYGEIPFDPDAGGMMDWQLGYFFFKWFGAGINGKIAVTYGSNQFVHEQGGDEDYKYWGYKTWGNVSGFARFQWPFERVVPYVNIHLGYSAARNRWNVYDDENYWDDIWEHESDHSYPIEGERDERYSGPMRHFTFAFEPGIDIFVAKRMMGVGIKAWLPVVASSESETDNVGLLMSFIFTPTWRGAPVLKEKYQNKVK